MSEANKHLIRRFLNDVFEQMDERAVDELVAEDIVMHEPDPPGVLRGIEAFKGYWRQFANLRDMHIQIFDIVAESDKVMPRFHVTAKRGGAFLGEEADGGEEWRLRTLTMYRCRDGRVAESWTGVGAESLWTTGA